MNNLRRWFRSQVPNLKAFDNLYAWLRFVLRHRRFPSRRRQWLNDALYHIRTSSEIENPLRVFVSDKALVKLYVGAVVGEAHVVPTLALLDSAEAIHNYQFPERCCIKPTHGSGEVILRAKGEPIDVGRVVSWLKLDMYRSTRERNYRTLEKRVIVEPLVFDDPDPMDFKFFCYRGAPKLIQVDFDRHTDHTRAFFHTDWTRTDFSTCYPVSSQPIEAPKNLALMLDVAAKLSANFSLVRIDLYTNGRECAVGEITNVHGAALEKFIPAKAEPIASKTLFG